MFIPMHKKNKRAVSEIIGYILLITFAIVIAGVVYSWLKTYVPKEGIACPDEVSVYISEYDSSVKNKLSLTLKNNGQFSVGGIFIYYSTDETQEIAVNDLSEYLNIETEAMMLKPPTGGGLRFGTATSQDNLNLFEPGEDKEIIFDINGIDKIYAVEIIPIRWQAEGTKKPAPVSCANAKTKKILDLEIKIVSDENLQVS